MRVFITGGTGFIGGAIVRHLLQAGHTVKALVRPGADTRQIKGLAVEKVVGDLSDVASMKRGMLNIDWIFHVAALYSYYGHTWEEFYQANVEGTRRTLQLAGESGACRIVYTSSIAALGIPRGDVPANEETPVTLAEKTGGYKRSKFLAEEIARDYARQGLPVVIVNPAAPIGAGDYKPTATGQIVLDFLKGKMFGYVDTGMCIVDVENVAAGHLLAAELGRVGERYILGGENLTLKQVLDLLAEVSGLPPARLHIPHNVALAWSYIDVGLAKMNPSHIPAATPEKVRLSRLKEYYDSSKAMRELGFPPTDARSALRRSVEWYRANGYLDHI